MVDSGPDVPRKIIRNTLYNSTARVLAIVIALILTPYIIHHIGGERYGIWAIIGMVTGYFGLLDLGVETAFVKYISEYHAKKEYQCINRVVNTGIIFYAFLVLVLLVGMDVVSVIP